MQRDQNFDHALTVRERLQSFADNRPEHAAAVGALHGEAGPGRSDKKISTGDGSVLGRDLARHDADDRKGNFIRGPIGIIDVMGRSGDPGFSGINTRDQRGVRLAREREMAICTAIDLQDVAYRHPGLRVERFSAMVANVGRKGGSGRADVWVLIDGQVVAHHQRLTPDTPPLALDLHFDGAQRFLTLVSTDSGNGNGLDWITLGDPRLHLVEAP